MTGPTKYEPAVIEREVKKKGEGGDTRFGLWWTPGVMGVAVATDIDDVLIFFLSLANSCHSPFNHLTIANIFHCPWRNGTKWRPVFSSVCHFLFVINLINSVLKKVEMQVDHDSLIVVN